MDNSFLEKTLYFINSDSLSQIPIPLSIKKNYIDSPHPLKNGAGGFSYIQS